MSYRNKTYVIFNADYPKGSGDLREYRLMQAWKENKNIDFNFHDAHDLNNLLATSSEETIKRKLHERMANAKQAVVLVGEHTKNMHKFVRWEIEIAIKMDIPIVAANLNGSNFTSDRTPAILKNEAYFMNVPFGPNKIRYALDNFPDAYHKNKHKSPDSRRYTQFD